MTVPPGMNPDDVDPALLAAYVSRLGDDPDTDDAPYGRPLDWTLMPAASVRRELHRLRPFVAHLAVQWQLSHTVLPPCWELHRPLVAVMSSVRDAHDAAFADGQPGSAASDWLRVWQWAQGWLAELATVDGCSARGGHTPGRPQAWAADLVTEGPDGPAWAQMDERVDADIEARVAAEARRSVRLVADEHQ